MFWRKWFNKATKTPKMIFEFISQDNVKITVEWGVPKDEQDAIEISRQMSGFFLLLDRASALDNILEQAIIEYGIIAKQQNVADAVIQWLGEYRESKVPVRQAKKNRVIVPANKALEP